MPRPKALKDLPLIPGKTTIDTSKFEKGFIGNIDYQGRVPTVGEEYAGREVIILIKNKDLEWKKLEWENVEVRELEKENEQLRKRVEELEKENTDLEYKELEARLGDEF